METAYDEGMDIYVDYGMCEGCGACAEVYPELFEMRDAQAWVLHHGRLSPEQCTSIARVCPFNAIVVYD